MKFTVSSAAPRDTPAMPVQPRAFADLVPARARPLRPRRRSASPNTLTGAVSVATDREPPFDGGSQPVRQVKDPIPPSRASPRAALMLGVLVLFLLAGAVFIFRIFAG